MYIYGWMFGVYMCIKHISNTLVHNIHEYIYNTHTDRINNEPNVVSFYISLCRPQNNIHTISRFKSVTALTSKCTVQFKSHSERIYITHI